MKLWKKNNQRIRNINVAEMVDRFNTNKLPSVEN